MTETPSRSADTCIISARKLCKTYRTREVETQALEAVSFDIASGDFVVFRGPSGCGKSTLLSIMGLLDRPDGGELLIGGQPTSTLTEAERSRLRGQAIGFVFQSFNLIPYLTVFENVVFGIRQQGVPKVECRRRAELYAEKVGIANRLSHFPDQLSGGQQQRAAICRALVTHPRILLADEPTGNLDSRHGDQIMDLLSALNEDGATICLVTHDERYQSLGNRTLSMQDGALQISCATTET